MSPSRPKERSVSTRGVLLIVLFLVLYAVCRVITLPANPTDTWGFTHDGAYLSIAARNIYIGKGFVLDGLWPVFAQRGSLPMPCDNSNPLYPVMMAGSMGLFGIGAPAAGFLVSALSSVGLIVALIFLLRPYVGSPYVSLAIAFVIACFPPVWDSSWTLGTDETWVMFMVAFLAALVRSDRLSMAAAAGLFFGLAWLTRSAATMVIPGLIVWALMTHGWRKALPRMVLFGLVAVVVASPWLIESARLWGSPFHSNLGDMTSAHVDSWNYSGPVTRAFHQPVAPPPYTRVLMANPGWFISHWLRGVAPALRELLRSTQGSAGVAVLPSAGRFASLGILLLLAMVAVIHRPLVWRSAGLISTAAFLGIFIAFISIALPWAEGRYYILIHVLFAAWICTSLYAIVRQFHGRRRPPLYTAALAAAALYGFVLLPVSDYRDAHYQRLMSPELAEYARAAQSLDRTIVHGGAVVVGNYPYYYSAATRAPALAIPEMPDQDLLSFMDRYHASHIFLTTGERDFWRPSWSRGMVPAGLQPVEADPGRKFCIYKRVAQR